MDNNLLDSRDSVTPDSDRDRWDLSDPNWDIESFSDESFEISPYVCDFEEAFNPQCFQTNSCFLASTDEAPLPHFQHSAPQSLPTQPPSASLAAQLFSSTTSVVSKSIAAVNNVLGLKTPNLEQRTFNDGCLPNSKNYLLEMQKSTRRGANANFSESFKASTLHNAFGSGHRPNSLLMQNDHTCRAGPHYHPNVNRDFLEPPYHVNPREWHKKQSYAMSCQAVPSSATDHYVARTTTTQRESEGDPNAQIDESSEMAGWAGNVLWLPLECLRFISVRILLFGVEKLELIRAGVVSIADISEALDEPLEIAFDKLSAAWRRVNERCRIWTSPCKRYVSKVTPRLSGGVLAILSCVLAVVLFGFLAMVGLDEDDGAVSVADKFSESLPSKNVFDVSSGVVPWRLPLGLLNLQEFTLRRNFGGQLDLTESPALRFERVSRIATQSNRGVTAKAFEMYAIGIDAFLTYDWRTFVNSLWQGLLLDPATAPSEWKKFLPRGALETSDIHGQKATHRKTDRHLAENSLSTSKLFSICPGPQTGFSLIRKAKYCVRGGIFSQQPIEETSASMTFFSATKYRSALDTVVERHFANSRQMNLHISDKEFRYILGLFRLASLQFKIYFVLEFADSTLDEPTKCGECWNKSSPFNQSIFPFDDSADSHFCAADVTDNSDSDRSEENDDFSLTKSIVSFHQVSEPRSEVNSHLCDVAFLLTQTVDEHNDDIFVDTFIDDEDSEMSLLLSVYPMLAAEYYRVALSFIEEFRGRIAKNIRATIYETLAACAPAFVSVLGTKVPDLCVQQVQQTFLSKIDALFPKQQFYEFCDVELDDDFEDCDEDEGCSMECQFRV